MTTTLQTLEALEIEFQDRGLNCSLSSVVKTHSRTHQTIDEVPAILIIDAGGDTTIGVFDHYDKLQAVEYVGQNKRHAVRTNLGDTLLCDPNGFAEFIEMIVNRLK